MNSSEAGSLDAQASAHGEIKQLNDKLTGSDSYRGVAPATESSISGCYMRHRYATGNCHLQGHALLLVRARCETTLFWSWIEN